MEDLDKKALEVAKVKENLQDWKEILVHLKHILMWEEQWHPALVGGGVSLLFLANKSPFKEELLSTLDQNPTYTSPLHIATQN